MIGFEIIENHMIMVLVRFPISLGDVAGETSFRPN